MYVYLSFVSHNFKKMRGAKKNRRRKSKSIPTAQWFCISTKYTKPEIKIVDMFIFQYNTLSVCFLFYYFVLPSYLHECTVMVGINITHPRTCYTISKKFNTKNNKYKIFVCRCLGKSKYLFYFVLSSLHFEAKYF